jgi:hypothetical protein
MMLKSSLWVFRPVGQVGRKVYGTIAYPIRAAVLRIKRSQKRQRDRSRQWWQNNPIFRTIDRGLVYWGLSPIRWQSWSRRSTLFLFTCLFTLTFTGVLGWFLQPASAATTLAIETITWDFVGLDSNKPETQGPETYIVGARVCNLGSEPARNVRVRFQKDGIDNGYTFIRLTGGDTYYTDSISVDDGSEVVRATNYVFDTRANGSLAKSKYNSQLPSTPQYCQDYYYNFKVDRLPAAWNTYQRYYITAQADNASIVSTERPRQIYIEKLISQARNEVYFFGCDAAGGTTYTTTATVQVGDVFTCEARAYTSTAYPQLSFTADIPNVIFQILDVQSTYSNPGGSTNNTVYADACGWVNDPRDPRYHLSPSACSSEIIPGLSTYSDQYPYLAPPAEGNGGVGNSVTTKYKIKVIGFPDGVEASNPIQVSNVILDFSGSSFHYNADYGQSPNIVNITVDEPNPTDLSVDKSHSDPFGYGNRQYQLVVSDNLNSSNAKAPVILTDTLPTGYVFVDKNPSIPGIQPLSNLDGTPFLL